MGAVDGLGPNAETEQDKSLNVKDRKSDLIGARARLIVGTEGGDQKGHGNAYFRKTYVIVRLCNMNGA